ncbi:MAG TPA: rhomboid family intramembrane serine protease [Solirubrobacteraceae bacterium]|nr:rhomboid family intramembrane serine protease [Solirubrobacteraceae bacterium]
MSTGGPDLFVVCKSCGSEVSPYITECPYCGSRLRKRAPKLDRDQRVSDRKARQGPSPLLTRLRRDEIPGIRGETRPYATGALVLASLVACVLYRTSLGVQDLVVIGQPGAHWWRLFTSVFAYDNIGYAFVTLLAVAVFGWLLERRHGPFVVLTLFLIGGVGGLAANIALHPNAIELGANGAALALLCAWAVPDLLALRRHEDVEGDLIGAAAIAVAVALMPLADANASWIADAVGVIAGFAIGLPLALLADR